VKQVIAAIAVLAILIVAVVVVMNDEDEPEVAGITETDTSETAAAADAAATTAEGSAADAAATVEDAAAEVVETAEAVAPDSDAAVDGQPSFDVVRVETSGDAVMAGRADPGAAVTIMTRNGVLAETTADERGEWVVVLQEPLPPGSHEIWLEASHADGSTRESGEAVVMTVPGADGTTATAEATDGGTGEVLAVTVPREGSAGEVAVLQAPASGLGISGGGALTLESLSYDDKGAVTLSGTADPGAEVRPYVNGTLAGRVTADEEGHWSLTLDQPLTEGRHDLRIDQVDATGQVAQRLETPIQQAAFTMPASAEPVIVIQPGNNLWLIARHVYGQGVLYTQIFEANRDQIVDPDLIFPGQIFVLPSANTDDS